MEIKVLEGNVNSYKETDTIYILDFGNIKKDSTAKVNFKIENIIDSTMASTCGCSTIKLEDKNTFTAQYNNTHIVAPFSKVLTLNYREGSSNKQAQVKLKGNVIV